MALPKTVALIAKLYPCSRSFSSTLIWLTPAFFQAKQSSAKGIEEIYFHRNRMDREFWRCDGSPVDLKLCDIRIMSVKCLNCSVWLKKVSRIRGKFQKFYLLNISDSKIRQCLPSSNIWNAFAEMPRKSYFIRMIFFTLFTTYFLFPHYIYIIFGSNLDSIDSPPPSGWIQFFYDLDKYLFLDFYFVTLLYCWVYLIYYNWYLISNNNNNDDDDDNHKKIKIWWM